MPGMQERGYNRDIAAGLIVGGASLAPIIPPSLLAIIVGSIADVSIAKLLIAGVIPGLVLGGIFLVYVFIRIAMDSSLAPANVAGEREDVTAGETGDGIGADFAICNRYLFSDGLHHAGHCHAVRIGSNRGGRCADNRCNLPQSQLADDFGTRLWRRSPYRR